MKNRFCLVLVLILNFITNTNAQNRSSAFPIITMGLKEINVPALGIGHFIKNDWKKGSLFLISEGLTYYYANRPIKIKIDTLAYPCKSSPNKIYKRNIKGISPSQFAKYSFKNYSRMASYTLKDIDLFLSFQNYRKDETHSELLSDASFWKLSSSPFNIKYLREPEVFLPIVTAVAFSLFGYDSKKSIFTAKSINLFGKEFSPMKSAISKTFIDMLLFNLVAVSEEMIFRGMIQTELSEHVNPEFGLITSSILFGLAHLPRHNWTYSLRAMGAGFYLGWQYQKYNNDLRRVIAIHFHLDFLPTIIEFFKHPATGQGVYSVTY